MYYFVFNVKSGNLGFNVIEGVYSVLIMGYDPGPGTSLECLELSKGPPTVS